MEFDETEAIKYILDNAETSRKYDDDQILNVIDIIWDYYEDNGFLDISLDDDDSEVDSEALLKHVAKMLRKDKGSCIAEEDVAPIVLAELAYESTLD